jgi:hypothetical protein
VNRRMIVIMPLAAMETNNVTCVMSTLKLQSFRSSIFLAVYFHAILFLKPVWRRI